MLDSKNIGKSIINSISNLIYLTTACYAFYTFYIFLAAGGQYGGKLPPQQEKLLANLTKMMVISK
jgi:hypothetical protein